MAHYKTFEALSTTFRAILKLHDEALKESLSTPLEPALQARFVQRQQTLLEIRGKITDTAFPGVETALYELLRTF